MLSEADLIGVWRLISNLGIDESGATSEGPLGPEPKGLLIYSPHGYMSVSMMRPDSVLSSDSRSSADGSGPRNSPTAYMGYSGVWRLVDGVVVHEVEVSSHRHIVNTKQIRQAVLDDDRLTLYAAAIIDGRPARRMLSWQRAEPDHRSGE